MAKKTNEQVTFSVIPVAWNGEKVTKYQAHARFLTKAIYGNPMPTEEQAIKDLGLEIEEWVTASLEIAGRYDQIYKDKCAI